MSFIIDHDLHIHTQLSSCSNHPEQTPAAILNYAVENHLRHICLADHFWDETVPGASGWYEPQNYGHVTKALPLPTAEGIRFDFGCETDMNRFGTLGISRETLDRFDFVIVPTNHLHMGIFSYYTKALWELKHHWFALLQKERPTREEIKTTIYHIWTKLSHFQQFVLLPQQEP